MTQAKRDENRVPTLQGVTDDSSLTPTNLLVDPATKRLKVSAVIALGAITSINSDSTAAQTIALGSTGTDANIVDGGTGTHTIHLPTASATARGLLSSANWSTFNGKANVALDNLASVAINAPLQWNNSAATSLDIAPTANTVVGRALTVSAGSTVTAGTADMAGGNLTLNSGLGKGTGASSIIFQTGRTLTTGSTLQTLTEAMRILGNGNVGIGTTGPTGKLDIQGLAANDLPTYSAEFLSATGWTSTGWTGDWATGWTHTTGNTTVISQSTAAVSATKYQIAYTVTGRTAGSFTIGFGGATSAAITATGAWGPTTSSTASLTITPTTDFNGTIVISIKSITAISTPLVNLKSSDGTARIEMRANTATGNTFIGIGAGRYNTTGYYNTANGMQSLYSNTTGYYNTANGVNSLYYNTTGNYNTANGVNSLYSNTTGNQNTANGYASLLSNTTGNQNTANGYASLLSNTTGYQNTANGYASLLYNTTGNQNTANGVNSLYYNTTGNYNTANGMQSLYSLRPTSKAITAFADYSGTVAGTVKATSVAHGLTGVSTKMISGTTNYNGSKSITVIDADTFYFTATWTTTQTGWWAIDSEGRYNTAEGVNAGRTLITGDSNTFLGYSAGYNASQLATAVNSMALGNGAFTTANNQVVIGNTSVTQTLLNGNVGIGTTSPGAKLDLPASTATAGTSSLKINAGVGLTVPVAGCIFFDGTDLFIDI